MSSGDEIIELYKRDVDMTLIDDCLPALRGRAHPRPRGIRRISRAKSHGALIRAKKGSGRPKGYPTPPNWNPSKITQTENNLPPARYLIGVPRPAQSGFAFTPRFLSSLPLGNNWRRQVSMLA